MKQGTEFLATYKLLQVALDIHIKHYDRHIAVPAQGESRLVHNLQMLLHRLVEGQFIILYGGRVLLRVGGVDSIHPRSLQKHVGTDFKGSQSGT